MSSSTAEANWKTLALSQTQYSSTPSKHIISRTFESTAVVIKLSISQGKWISGDDAEHFLDISSNTLKTPALTFIALVE